MPETALKKRPLRPPITEYFRLDEILARHNLFEGHALEERITREEDLRQPPSSALYSAVAQVRFTCSVAVPPEIAPAFQDYLLHRGQDMATLIHICEDLRKENAYLRLLHDPTLAAPDEKKD